MQDPSDAPARPPLFRAIHILWIFLLALAPWLLAVAATLFATNLLGCRVHEGGVNPCVALGWDLGGFFYSTGVWAAWGLLFTPFPLAYAAAAYLILLLVRWMMRRAADRRRA